LLRKQIDLSQKSANFYFSDFVNGRAIPEIVLGGMA
jgi:hypothetical protein